MWQRRLRYEKTRYLDASTGEVMIGEKSFRRIVSERGWSVRFLRTEVRNEDIGEIRYITTTRHFKVEGVNNKLKF